MFRVFESSVNHDRSVFIKAEETANDPTPAPVEEEYMGQPQFILSLRWVSLCRPLVFHEKKHTQAWHFNLCSISDLPCQIRYAVFLCRTVDIKSKFSSYQQHKSQSVFNFIMLRCIFLYTNWGDGIKYYRLSTGHNCEHWDEFISITLNLY